LGFVFREESEGNEQEIHSEAPIDTSSSTRTIFLDGDPRWRFKTKISSRRKIS
jgi:hypothetical protein